MIFATGITQNYEPRAMEFIYSAMTHRIPVRLYLVDYFDTPTRLCHLPCRPIRYANLPHQLPKWMLQHGGFTIFENEPDDLVIAFLDADARFQRPFTQAEYDFMTPRPGEFLIGRNKTDPNQPLLDEARLVSATPEEELIRAFPGCESMVCRNFGFVVARNGDWKKLYARFNELWPEVLARFSNPAQVQWLCMYVVQKHLSLGPELPLSIHAHGHHGLAPGVHCQNGTWMLNDQVIAFAHNLDWLK